MSSQQFMHFYQTRGHLVFLIFKKKLSGFKLSQGPTEYQTVGRDVIGPVMYVLGIEPETQQQQTIHLNRNEISGQ